MRGQHSVALAGVVLSLSIVSCSNAPAISSSDNGWQLVLTVKADSVNLGIPGIALDRHGNLFLAEFDDSKIYKYSTAGKLLATWGGYGSGAGQLEAPDKLAFDAQGNLYVTEVGAQYGAVGINSRVQKFSPTGMSLAHWGTFGSGSGQFNGPIGIAVDQQGDIYVAEEGNHRVQKLSSDGQFLVQWHTVGSGTGPGTEIGYDLALDASGNVYVSDAHPFSSGNDRIQKFSPDGKPLAIYGGTGAGPGHFSNPTGLALDSKGNLFVVDSGNDRIQELSPTGQFVAQWKGPPGGLIFTSKVALDDHSNMYVSSGTEIYRRSL